MSWLSDTFSFIENPIQQTLSSFNKLLTDPGSLNFGDFATIGIPFAGGTIVSDVHHPTDVIGQAAVVAGGAYLGGATPASIAGGWGSASTAPGLAPGAGVLLPAPAASSAPVFYAPEGTLLPGEGVLSPAAVATGESFSAPGAAEAAGVPSLSSWSLPSGNGLFSAIGNGIASIGDAALKVGPLALAMLNRAGINIGGSGGGTPSQQSTSGPQIGVSVPAGYSGAGGSAPAFQQAGFDKIALILLIGAAIGLLFMGKKKK